MEGGGGGEGGIYKTRLASSLSATSSLLQPTSRELLTINTQVTIWGYIQLESRLPSIPYVKVRSVNVKHSENFRKLLKIIYNNGLRFKLKAVLFMQEEVNKNGIFPVKEKVNAI